MKKTYEKPVFAVEEFSLTQRISACSYLKIGFNTSDCVLNNPDKSDKMKPGYGHLYGLASVGYFWDPAGCAVSAETASETDQICYHTLANTAFTS